MLCPLVIMLFGYVYEQTTLAGRMLSDPGINAAR